MRPKPGDLLLITKRASVQFVAVDPFLFRVIRPHDWTTYQGWIWLDGYQLDLDGEAVHRRSLFVQLDGIIYRRRADVPEVPPGPRFRSWTGRAGANRSPIIRPHPRAYSDVGPDHH